MHYLSIFIFLCNVLVTGFTMNAENGGPLKIESRKKLNNFSVKTNLTLMIFIKFVSRLTA